MSDVNLENKILANVVFGINDIAKQMETVEQMAKKTAKTVEETFANAQLTSPSMGTGQMTAQQAMVQQITAQGVVRQQAIIAEGEAKKVAVIAKGEAQVSHIKAKEALVREQIAQKEARTQLAILQQQQAEEKLLYMKSRREAFEQQPKGFEGLIERRLSWMASGAMLFGGFSALSGIASTAKQVEYDVTTIARITEDAAFNFQKMRNELQGLGIEFGMQWKNVSDIAVRWSQAGYNVADTIELTRTSLLALNTAELDAQYATQGLIAIMAQWELNASELLPVIDKINKTADSYAVTSQDLVDGLNRVGAAARNAGMTLEETIGVLTVLREASGRTGKEVGTAVNTIISYMTRNKTINVMESLGIRVFEDEARTTFRSIIELMDEMATRWQNVGMRSQIMNDVEVELLESFNEEMATAIGLQEEWNDMQQRDMSQAAAGVRRRNFFISLMSRFSEVQGVVNQQLDAEGYSMRENERTMDTLEKQLLSLKAAMEQLAVVIGDAGLLNELKGLAEGTTNAIQAFNNLDSETQTVIFTLLEITLAVRLLSAALKLLGTSAGIAGIGGMMAGWAVPITATTVAARSLHTVLGGVGALLTNLGRGIVGLFGGPVGFALTATATAAIALKRNLDNAAAAMAENVDTASDLLERQAELVGKLVHLTDGTNEYIKTSEELVDIKTTLAGMFPELIEGYDDETKSIIINYEALDELIARTRELGELKELEDSRFQARMKNLEEEAMIKRKQIEQLKLDAKELPSLLEKREALKNIIAQEGEESEKAAGLKRQLILVDDLIAESARRARMTQDEIDKISIESMDDVIAKINEKTLATIESELATGESAKREIEIARERAQENIKAITLEITAIQEKQAALRGSLAKPGASFNPINSFRYWFNEKEVAKKGKALEAEQKAFNEKEEQLEVSLAKIRGLQEEAAKVDLTGGGSGGGGGGSGSGGAGSAVKAIDQITEYLNALSDSAKRFDLINLSLDTTLGGLGRDLNSVGAEYSYLVKKVETGIATTVDYLRMQELLADKQYYLTEEQRQLTLANQEYQRQIKALTPLLTTAKDEYVKFQQAGNAKYMEDAAKAVSSLQREIDRLSSSIASNTNKVWENKSAIEALANQAYAEYYSQAMSWMNHMQAIGRMNEQQQYDYLNSLEQSKLSQSDAWRLEEQQYQSRRKLLQDEMNNIKQAYDEKMRQYDREVEANEKIIELKEKNIDTVKAEADAQIAAIQKLIDALNDEGDQEDKEEAERQHNKRIAELVEQRQYHELRTGIEHQDAIKDINDQIAEENHSWQLKQNDWARDAQKKAYQDQIDSIREQSKKREDSIKQEINDIKRANDAKKHEMQRHYNEAERLLNDNVLNMLAAVGSANEQMFQKGLELMRAYGSGLAKGRGEVTSEFGDFWGSGVGSAYDNIPGGTGSGATGGYAPPKDNSGGGYSSTGTKEQAHARAESARALLRNMGFSQGVADISSYTTYDGTLGWYNSFIKNRTDLDQSVKSLFWEIVESRRIWTQLDQAHTGAYVQSTGAAQLLKGERVLSPELTIEYDRLSSILLSKPNVTDNLGGIGSPEIVRKLEELISMFSRGIINVDKAVSIDNVSFEDKADMQAFAIEVRSILTTKG